MKVSRALDQVRSMVVGSQGDEVTVLQSDYLPGNTQIEVKYPKKAVQPGALMSAGLATFVVMEATSDGRVFTVLPSGDGGPDVEALAGTRVRVKPKFTDWFLFSSLSDEIGSLSSRVNGIYTPWLIEATSVNYTSGMYAIPERTDGLVPMRLVKSEYKRNGSVMWVPFSEAEYQHEQNAIRVIADPMYAYAYRFVLALPFGQPADLDTELDDIGVIANLLDVVQLGVAGDAALSMEGRRVQPINQGDSRRASEVQVSGNSALARQFRAQQQQRIAEENARLAGLYGYRMSIGAGNSTGRWSR